MSEKRSFIVLCLLSVTIAAALASCSRNTSGQVTDMPELITQVPIEYFNDSTRDDYATRMRKAGITVALISVCDYFPVGAERDSMRTVLHDAIGFFEKEGFKVGVWTNSLGYGYHRPVLDTLCPGIQMLTDFNGAGSDAVCSTDKAFLDLIRQNVQDFARAGAKYILMDDDLVQSVRPGFTCACDNHLGLLEEATGKRFTREEVRDLFTGAPSAGRTAFMDITGKSLTDFCRSIREAVDEIDPSIPMAICSSYTHFDAEGVDMNELTRLLAGEGNPMTLRVSGATYWPVIAPRFPGQTLGEVCDFVRMQIGWYRRSDIVLFDENDPYPRDSKTVPPSYCELYDKVMLANGGIHRHKYMFCDDPAHPDRGYYEAHLAGMKDDKALVGMFKDKTPCGFRVWKSEHSIRDIQMDPEYAGNNQMMVWNSHSSAAAFMTENNIPVCFEGSGFPGIAFGDQARLLPEEAVRSGLILDVPAALALASKGIDVGLKSAEKVEVPGQEYLTYNLVPEEGIEATFLPSCLVCKTKDGIFAIYGWEGDKMIMLQGERPWTGQDTAAQLADLYGILSDGAALPAVAEKAESLYTLPSLSEDGSSMSVLFCNMGEKDAVAQNVKVPEGWKIRKALRTEATVEGTNLCLSKVSAQDWAAVELVRE